MPRIEDLGPGLTDSQWDKLAETFNSTTWESLEELADNKPSYTINEDGDYVYKYASAMNDLQKLKADAEKSGESALALHYKAIMKNTLERAPIMLSKEDGEKLSEKGREKYDRLKIKESKIYGEDLTSGEDVKRLVSDFEVVDDKVFIRNTGDEIKDEGVSMSAMAANFIYQQAKQQYLTAERMFGKKPTQDKMGFVEDTMRSFLLIDGAAEKDGLSQRIKGIIVSRGKGFDSSDAMFDLQGIAKLNKDFCDETKSSGPQAVLRILLRRKGHDLKNFRAERGIDKENGSIPFTRITYDEIKV